MSLLELVFLAWLAIAAWADHVVLPQGRLKGYRLLSRKGREIFAFQGIPYAKPPVGELRFKPPQPAEPWIGVLNATKEGPDCLQKPFPEVSSTAVVGDEDCLYLNVYTTRIPTDGAAAELQDVMFYIHGGGWISGSGSIALYGPQYLLDRNIVLVTINYRIGLLGFLTTGDEVCPGNNGLKDQVAALRWVRDNIAAFGGNPSSVTIFGESVGGASVHLHVLSETSKGLFHRGISQSGTAMCPWALSSSESMREQTDKLAARFGCPTQSSIDLVACLRNVDAKQIVGSIPSLLDLAGGPLMAIRPVVESAVGEEDEAFISKPPVETILSSHGQDLVPWMTGFTSSDGAILAATMYQKESLIKKLDEDFEGVLMSTVFTGGMEFPPRYRETARRIRKFYFGDQPINEDTRHALSKMYTDASLAAGAHSAVKLHATMGSQIYYYYFDYRGRNSFSTMFGDPTVDYGVCHMDELMYLFPQDHAFQKSKTAEDDEMVDIMTTIWTNFARTGNPTCEANNLVKWRPISSPETMEYGHIDAKGLHVERNLLVDRMKLWSSVLPAFGAENIKDEL